MNTRRMHYAWVMVIASAIIMAVIAIRLYTFGVFLLPLTERLHASRGAISFAATASSIMSGIISLLAGRLCDRYGPKAVVGLSGILHALGFLLATRITELWHLYLIWGLLMGPANAFTYIPIMSTIARWFNARRTTALGITIAGFAAGAIIWPPMTQWLLDVMGWSNTFLVLAGISAIGIIPPALLLKTSPASAGLRAYGDVSTAKVAKTLPTEGGLTLRQTIKTGRFWLWMLILFCFYSTLSVLFVHVVAHARDIGVPPIIAASTLSIIAGCSIIARVTIGSITDRIDSRYALIGAIGLGVAAFALLVSSHSLWAFYTFAVIFGLSYGSFVPLETAVPAGLFGLKSLGAVMAWAGLLSSIGSALAPPVAGAIYDATKEYLPAFYICLGLVGIGLVLSLLLLRSKEIKTHA